MLETPEKDGIAWRIVSSNALFPSPWHPEQGALKVKLLRVA
jgi:hypothetical protein